MTFWRRYHQLAHRRLRHDPFAVDDESLHRRGVPRSVAMYEANNYCYRCM